MITRRRQGGLSSFHEATIYDEFYLYEGVNATISHGIRFFFTVVIKVLKGIWYAELKILGLGDEFLLSKYRKVQIPYLSIST